MSGKVSEAECDTCSGCGEWCLRCKEVFVPCDCSECRPTECSDCDGADVYVVDVATGRRMR